MILKLVRTPGIYLVGFMCSGKTTVGRLLAERLGWHFIDLDEDIEAEQGASIASIFEDRGEEAFRALETDALRRRLRLVRGGRPVVMALGGGTFTRPENIELLEENGVTVWLDCSLETARRRLGDTDDRPLARDPEGFARLFEERRGIYAQANYRIDISNDDAAAAVAAICSLPMFH